MRKTDVDYNKILCPVDFSDCSRKAFYAAIGYARRFQAELVILHVVERNMSRAGFEAVEDQHLVMSKLEDGLVRRLDELEENGELETADRDRTTLEIAGGRPWVQILHHAVELETDLIVMGTHGHTGIKHLVMGSQAERVMRKAPCPVLFVKPSGFEPKLPERLIP